MFTKQETFDMVVAHLRKQGVPAVDGYVCKYRTPDGLKCAAGCLIPDGMYDESIELCRADDPAVASLLKAAGHDVDLVWLLQRAHDSWARYNADIWRSLSRVALEHNLQYALPPEAAS